MNDAAIERIIDRLADESYQRRNSAILCFLLGVIFQAGIVWLLFKAQSFASAGAGEKLGFFFCASFFVAWLPIAASVYYLHSSRKSAMRPENILYRALTGEPQLIARIEREPDVPQIEIVKPVAAPPSAERGANVAGAIVEGVLEVALSAAFGTSSDSNSNDYYDTNNGESLPNAPRIPRVFVSLTNGETREISSPLEVAQTIAALQKHAPQAVITEIRK